MAKPRKEGIRQREYRAFPAATLGLPGQETEQQGTQNETEEDHFVWPVRSAKPGQ